MKKTPNEWLNYDMHKKGVVYTTYFWNGEEAKKKITRKEFYNKYVRG